MFDIAYSEYSEYINPIHIRAFRDAAALFKVYILIRKTNAKSLQYMGRAGYTAKRLDCKWKTANRNLGPYQLAGLVTSPAIHPGAFLEKDGSVGKKFAAAVKEWKQHQDLIYVLRSNEDIDRIDLRGCRKPYTLQSNPRHKHYGCVALTDDGIVGPRYIHGDYDLYALVDADAPGKREVPEFEYMLGEPHVYGPKWFRIVMWVDARLGYPMIFHGEQEHYKDHEEDDLIVFFPDGQKVTVLQGVQQIRKFYEVELHGRKAFEKSVHGKPKLVRL